MMKTRSSVPKKVKDQSNPKPVVTPIRIRLSDKTIVQNKGKNQNKKYVKSFFSIEFDNFISFLFLILF